MVFKALVTVAEKTREFDWGNSWSWGSREGRQP